MTTLLSQNQAQISPGPLAQAHASLDRADQCLQCHARGEEFSMDQQCRVCHEAIDWQIEQQRGLHGNESLTECAKCHPDHAGRDFPLIDWPEGSAEKFDHNRTGWPLRAAHTQAECRDCHKTSFQVSPAAIKIKRDDPGQSWLGLDSDCLSCHQDFHRGALPRTCTDCHTMGGWVPAPGFDHSDTKFELTGRHIKVECDACHKTARVFRTSESGERLRHYAPIQHAECSACHADPHAGRLGAACSKCHVADNFDQISGDRFDHSATRYPLEGKHTGLACASCHDDDKAWGARPAFARCDSCHSDAHAGTATLLGAATDCASCHTVQGFKPSSYSVSDHADARFPLEGRHREVPCNECHTQNSGLLRVGLGSAGVLLRPAFKSCESCHAAAHADQFAQSTPVPTCESCHTVDRFKPSTFGAERHAELALPLKFAHLDAECSACHGLDRQDLPPLPSERELGPARVALTMLDPSCKACHFNPHGDALMTTLSGESVAADACAVCHGVESFASTKVDSALHAKFDFPLAGAHLATPCFECHADLSEPVGPIHRLRASDPLRELHFQVAKQACENCHESPHGNQFIANGIAQDCANCHGADAFVPASVFNHDTQSKFPLDGAHERVACLSCHVKETGTDGVLKQRFRPVPTECRACHVGGIADTLSTDRS